MVERITEAELARMVAFDPLRTPPEPSEDMVRVVFELRRLQGLLLGLADASGNVLKQDLATIAQVHGVETAQRLVPVLEEIKAIRAEREE
jgi:hypothetical protein